MGEVYKAYDTTLKRHVALKFLPPELTRDEGARKRFIHEAQAAAALDHPNICTVHEIGQSEGHTFIVMPLIEGQSLRERLESGPLPVDEALEMALQVGRGLSKAHGSGIVHRDIKPGNVLLTEDGQAKVVDFGLAKLGTQTKLTRTGTTLGTVSYMSPEQARGEEIDQRTDIWSLGAVLYEMLTGQQPFRGEYEPAVVYSIMNEEPEPVTAMREEVPVALEDVVERALAKDAEKRYQSIDEMLTALETVREETRLGIERRRRAAYKRLARRKRLLVGSVAVVVVAIAAVLITTLYKSGQAIDSLAVLPLENLSGDEEQDIFAEGITGELITNLNRLDGMKKVSARSAVMRYKNTDKSVSEIADELGVKAVVTGTMQREGDRIRITADLLDASTEKLLWADIFDGRMVEILTLQSQIAQAIADKINLELTPEEREQLAVERPVDPEAYIAYLKGNDYSYLWQGPRLMKAIEWYERAIEIDPAFAPAYARLSLIYSGGTSQYEKAESLATRALELDSRLPDAYMALGSIRLVRDWDWDGAEREAAKAERLLTSGTPCRELRDFYMFTGQWEKAFDMCRREVASDPLNWEPLGMLAWLFKVASRPEDTIEHGRRVLARFPDNEEAVEDTWSEMAEAYTMMGLTDSAFAIAEREGIEVPLKTYAAVGMRDSILVVLEKQLKEWEEYDEPQPSLAYFIGQKYGFLGDNDKAFEWLEKAYEGHAWWMLYLNNHMGAGGMDNLLEDPRLADLMRRVGFPRTNIERRLAAIEKYNLLEKSE